MNPLLEALHQPEYLHILLNPLPIYGLATGALALTIALVFRSRPAVLTALAVIALTAASAWPVYVLGKQAYENVNTTVDPDGQEWLDAHGRRAGQAIWVFVGLAVMAAGGAAASMRWPRVLLPVGMVALLGALVTLGAGGWIAYAGGKVRHREFRHGPPPMVEGMQDAQGR